MTNGQIVELIKDYNFGNGLTNEQLAKKYNTSKTTIRNKLIEFEVYEAQRSSYGTSIERVSSAILRLREEIKHKDEALRKIAEWELPESGVFWDKEEKSPMPYRVAFGIVSEVEYMRNIANEALKQ